LVEEFGYTHISTGDLMRAEIAKVSDTQIILTFVGLERRVRNQKDS
jgi:adenylate kinase family enzyme